MPVSYTNRKGQTYTLYRGQTKTGKPRYYFGRERGSQGEPVEEIPSGFAISESINGVVSLVKKDRPSPIQPEEVAAFEAAIEEHPEAHHYRAVVKQNRIEIYEQVNEDYDLLIGNLFGGALMRPGTTEQLRALQERHAQYTPIFRFTLLDPKRRIFSAERMCYRSWIDGWLKLMQTGTATQLAQTLIPTLGTDEFFELF